MDRLYGSHANARWCRCQVWIQSRCCLVCKGGTSQKWPWMTGIQVTNSKGFGQSTTTTFNVVRWVCNWNVKKCQVSGPKEGAVKLHRDAPKGRRHAMVQHPPPVRPSLLHSRKAYLVLSTKDANNARSQFQCNYSKSNKSLAEQATGGLLQLPLDPAQQPEQLAPTGVSTQEAKSTFWILVTATTIRFDPCTMKIGQASFFSDVCTSWCSGCSQVTGAPTLPSNASSHLAKLRTRSFLRVNKCPSAACTDIQTCKANDSNDKKRIRPTVSHCRRHPCNALRL